MAKNSEVYKTAQERLSGFRSYCGSLQGKCSRDITCDECHFAWLDLEADEEKPDECFYCGHSTEIVPTNNGRTFAVKCTNDLCGYQSGSDNRHDTIASHNRVAKKCQEGKE